MRKSKVFKKLLSFKIVIFLFSLLLIFVLVLLNISVSNPASWPFYSLKRLYEKTQLSLKSNPEEKLNYQYNLLDNRLTELIFIAENQISSQVLTTSLRYSTTVGQITELIIKDNLKGEAQKAKEKFEAHLLIVKELSQTYPKDDSEAKYIIDDVNYLQTYINLLSSFSSK